MSFFLHQLTRSIGVFLRTVRAFFSRRIMGITSMLRRLTNFSRHATRVASSSLQEVVSAAQKPTSRSDYVETGKLYISKALIIRILLLCAAIGLILYFVVWPFVLSHFLTARFYEQDERTEDWSGRVILYSDEKKTIPRYAGRLEEGMKQGEGRLYDQNGTIVYEGQFRDGARSGSGKEYRNGVLVYEGQFEAGLYNGRGKSFENEYLSYEGQYEDGLRSGNGTAYQDGVRVYEGQFADDLYEGHGKLYRDGVLYYEGNFHIGVPEGTGTLYHSSGKPAYQGQFLSGQAEGSGTSFDETGRKIYSGSYEAGEYSGAGVQYLEDGGQLEASFLNGKPTGNVQWKKNGILYYCGEWENDVPSGYGTITDKTGKVLYEGPFCGGTIDGNSLLDYSAEELRSAFGEGSVRNVSDGDTFRIIAEELGLTAVCTCRSEDSDSRVIQLCLSAPEKGDWVAILPGMAHTEALLLAAEPSEQTYTRQTGVNAADGTYPAESALQDGRQIRILYGDENREQAILVIWELPDAVPEPSTDEPAGDANGDSAKLLYAMDTMLGIEGTTVSKGTAFGDRSTAEALAGITEPEQAVRMVEILLDYWNQNQRLSLLNEAAQRSAVLLADAKAAQAGDVGSSESAEALEQKQTELEAEMEACRIAIKRTELLAESAGAENPGEYALEELPLLFNPAEQDVSSLALAAVAYAQAIGSEIDAAEVENAVKTGLLDLQDAYNEVNLAMTRCKTAEANTRSMTGAYSMELASRTAWFEAMNEEAMSRISLYSALTQFTRLAGEFNLLTGGWVSRTFDWHRDVFDELFRSAIAEAEMEEAGAEPDETEAAEEPAPVSEPAASAENGADGEADGQQTAAEDAAA